MYFVIPQYILVHLSLAAVESKENISVCIIGELKGFIKNASVHLWEIRTRVVGQIIIDIISRSAASGMVWCPRRVDQERSDGCECRCSQGDSNHSILRKLLRSPRHPAHGVLRPASVDKRVPRT